MKNKKMLMFVFIILIAGINLYANDNSKVTAFKKLELFNKVLYLIEHQYYRDIDVGKLVDGAIKGMVATLDPHSSFLDEKHLKRMEEDTKGEFGGLGIEVTIKDGIIVIVTPIPGTPAAKAGILPGDKIFEINHEDVVGLSVEEVVDKMKGPVGRPITLGIKNGRKPNIQRITLVREKIKINPVKSEILEKEFIYMRLSQFQAGSAKSMIKSLEENSKIIQNNKGELKGIILDLRSNPGGLLDEAVDVSSIFLNDGIVVSTEARDPKNKEFRYVKKTGYKDIHTPLVVLINGSSASASEIVAGAIKDHKRGVVMGTTSFGKGSVQTVAKLDEKNGLKLTIAQYMTPSGRKIQAIGIVPDIELDEVDPKTGRRSQKTLYLREVDLRNHLTATIETPEEKVIREEREKLERMIRRKGQENKTPQQESEDIAAKIVAPAEDYQVLQSIKHLRTAKKSGQ